MGSKRVEIIVSVGIGSVSLVFSSCHSIFVLLGRGNSVNDVV